MAKFPMQAVVGLLVTLFGIWILVGGNLLNLIFGLLTAGFGILLMVGKFQLNSKGTRSFSLRWKRR